MNLVYEWLPPTKNVDGSTIPATGPGSLVSTRIQFGLVTGTGVGEVIEERGVRAAEREAWFKANSIGTYFVKGFVRNTHGQESVDSPALQITVGAV